MENNNIYIDLDSLFDTRLGMLYTLNKKIANDVYNTTYYTRSSDEFGHMPISVFNAYYRLRNKNLLALSPPTNAIKLLVELRRKIDSDPKHTDNPITIYVNVFPYKLTTEEKDNIAKILLNYIKYTNIEIIDKGIEQLTPEIMGADIDSIVMYDGLKWLNTHMTLGGFVNNPLIDKIMYIPGLVVNNKEKKDKSELLKTLAEQLSFFINIVPVEIEVFNSIRYEK